MNNFRFAQFILANKDGVVNHAYSVTLLKFTLHSYICIDNAMPIILCRVVTTANAIVRFIYVKPFFLGFLVPEL